MHHSVRYIYNEAYYTKLLYKVFQRIVCAAGRWSFSRTREQQKTVRVVFSKSIFTSEAGKMWRLQVIKEENGKDLCISRIIMDAGQ